MANTSADGGYIIATSTTDSDIWELLHDMLQGLTGFDSNLIRKMWQKNPPPSPENGIDWIAYGFSISEDEDGGAYLEPTDETESVLYKHEELELSLQIYGDDCQLTAGIIKDGLQVKQNREALYLNKIVYIGASKTLHVPEQINNEFFNRCDLTLTFRRQIERTYGIMNLVDAQGTIYPDREEVGEIEFNTVIP